MKKSDLENLTSGLQTGIGLTRSCELVGLDIQSVSNEMEKDVKLVNELKEAVIYAGKTLLLMSQSNMQSKQFDKWLSQNEYVKKFHTELVTWESYCKKFAGLKIGCIFALSNKQNQIS